MSTALIQPTLITATASVLAARVIIKPTAEYAIKWFNQIPNHAPLVRPCSLHWSMQCFSASVGLALLGRFGYLPTTFPYMRVAGCMSTIAVVILGFCLRAESRRGSSFEGAFLRWERTQEDFSWGSYQGVTLKPEWFPGKKPRVPQLLIIQRDEVQEGDIACLPIQRSLRPRVNLACQGLFDDFQNFLDANFVEGKEMVFEYGYVAIKFSVESGQVRWTPAYGWLEAQIAWMTALILLKNQPV